MRNAHANTSAGVIQLLNRSEIVLSSFNCSMMRIISTVLSLSTIVLNSRDWYEIIWLPEISRFKNQPYNRFYPKKPAGMH